jgi:hypothetical protein
LQFTFVSHPPGPSGTPAVKSAHLELSRPHPSSSQNQPPLDPNDDDDSDDESSDSDYQSFADDSDDEEDNQESKAEREAREHERQLVLQAAGLIVKKDVKPPPRPPRPTAGQRRRPAPAAPDRSILSTGKDLPQVPDEIDPNRRIDDAFDRYESFRHTHGNVNLNRLSVASIETTASSSSISTLAPSGSWRDSVSSAPTSLAPSASRDSESSGYSHLLHFLGRRTPVSDSDGRARPVISGPILNKTVTPPRENSPAFGTSWASLVDKTALEGIPSDERRRQEAIFELINTEAAYVRDLQLIVEVSETNPFWKRKLILCL